MSSATALDFSDTVDGMEPNLQGEYASEGFRVALAATSVDVFVKSLAIAFRHRKTLAEGKGSWELLVGSSRYICTLDLVKSKPNLNFDERFEVLSPGRKPTSSAFGSNFRCVRVDENEEEIVIFSCAIFEDTFEAACSDAASVFRMVNAPPGVSLLHCSMLLFQLSTEGPNEAEKSGVGIEANFSPEERDFIIFPEDEDDIFMPVKTGPTWFTSDRIQRKLHREPALRPKAYKYEIVKGGLFNPGEIFFIFDVLSEIISDDINHLKADSLIESLSNVRKAKSRVTAPAGLDEDKQGKAGNLGTKHEGLLTREFAVEALKLVERESPHASQRKFIESLGVSRSVYHKCITGEATIDQICDLLEKAGRPLFGSMSPPGQD